jgi:multiple sugar transport system substrate-binding protein
MKNKRGFRRRIGFFKYLHTSRLAIALVVFSIGFFGVQAWCQQIPLEIGEDPAEQNIPIEIWDSESFILSHVMKMKKEGKIPKDYKISLLVCEGTTAQIDWLKPIWKEVAGIEVEFITVPLYDLSMKLMAEAVAKSGVYDAMIYPDEYVADAVESGLLADMSKWMEKYKYNLDKWPSPFTGGTFYKQVLYMGKPYQMICDGDVWVPFYRSDLLDDPKEQSAFQKKYGYALPKWGAETWDQLYDMMAFFHRPDMVQTLPDGSERKGLTGGWWFRTLEEIGDVFLIRLISRGGMYFDDKTNAAINSPEGIAVLEEMKRETQFLPDVAVTGTWTEMYSDFPSGKNFSAFSWPSLGKFSNTGAIQGHYRIGKVPGYKIDGKIRRTTLRRGTLSFAISNYGDNPELAFLFMAYMTSPRISSIVVSKTGYFDAFREGHFSYPPIVESYGSKHVGVEQTTESLSNLRFNQTQCMPNLLLERYEEYRENLAAACHKYITGSGSAKEALDNAAKNWDRITKSVGKERVSKRYNALKPLFPKDIRELHGW